MASITITVQSLLNTAVYNEYTIDNGQTIAQLKTAIQSATGVNTSWFGIVQNQRLITNESATLSSLGIVTGTQLRTSNQIAKLATLEDRQRAKLDLAALDRSASGESRATLDISELPAQYSGNTSVPNSHPTGLVEGRPWIYRSYTFSSVPGSINEGVSGTFNVSTAGVADGTTLYWTIESDASDFTTTSGSFNISSNAGSFALTPTADLTTEGAKSFTVAIRTGSTSGTIVATSNSIGVNDTSLTPSFSNPTFSLNNVTTVAQSPFAGGGNSYSFDGSGTSTITSAGSADWAFGTGDFTIEWFQYETDNNSFPRVFHRGLAYPAQEIGVSIEGGTFYGWFKGATSFGSAVPYKNAWTHFAVVRSGSNLKVFKNGTQLGSTVSNTTNFTDTSAALTVGRETSGTAGTQFGGYITSFRWIKGLAVYTGNFTVPTSALTATASANPYGGSNTQAVPAGYTKLLLAP